MRTLAIIAVAALLGTGASAQETDADVAAGKKTTQHVCGNCHDASGKVPPTHPPGGAPAFVEISQSPEWTSEKLRQFLRFPHGRMVNVLLTGKEADNAVKYILSLKKK